MILLRAAPLSVSFLVRVLFLFGKARFVSGAGSSCRPPFLRNYQSAADRFAEPPLGSLTVAELASRVARNDTNCAFLADACREFRDEALALFVGQCFGLSNVPRDLDTR